jgi:Protein of unknown function (DUF3617)
MRMNIALLACALAALPAAAQDFPKLKSGQWEMSTTSTKNADLKPNAMTMCTDDAVQKQMMDMGKGMSRDLCSKMDVRHEGGKFVGDSVCMVGQSTMTSHSVMTTQGDTSYKTVITATYDPPLMGMKDGNTVVEGKYVGPCRDGMQPGDVIGPNGQKFNTKSYTMPARPTAQPPAPAK